ncbi:MAG: hypothetical protein ACRDOF_09990 [Gaiellaceae bacterium]
MERFAPALQDVLNCSVAAMEGFIINRAPRDDRRVNPVPIYPRVEDNDLLCVSEDRDVCTTRIREWQKHADVYAYFNDDWRGHAVKEAIRLRELASGL